MRIVNYPARLQTALETYRQLSATAARVTNSDPTKTTREVHQCSTRSCTLVVHFLAAENAVGQCEAEGYGEKKKRGGKGVYYVAMDINQPDGSRLCVPLCESSEALGIWTRKMSVRKIVATMLWLQKLGATIDSITIDDQLVGCD